MSCAECGMTMAELLIVALVYLIPLVLVLGIGAFICDRLAARQQRRQPWEVDVNG